MINIRGMTSKSLLWSTWWWVWRRHHLVRTCRHLMILRDRNGALACQCQIAKQGGL